MNSDLPRPMNPTPKAVQFGIAFCILNIAVGLIGFALLTLIGILGLTYKVVNAITHTAKTLNLGAGSVDLTALVLTLLVLVGVLLLVHVACFWWLALALKKGKPTAWYLLLLCLYFNVVFAFTSFPMGIVFGALSAFLFYHLIQPSSKEFFGRTHVPSFALMSAVQDLFFALSFFGIGLMFLVFCVASLFGLSAVTVDQATVVIAILLFMILALLFMGLGIFNYLVYRGLTKGKKWTKPTQVVLCVIGLLFVPFGTIWNGVSLYLFSKESLDSYFNQ